MTRELKFKNPTFAQRIKGMLGVDFYRLFHTPMFYIFLGIAAIIPAMVSMGGGEGASMYTTAWQIIAASEPLYVVNSIAIIFNQKLNSISPYAVRHIFSRSYFDAILVYKHLLIDALIC